MGTPGDHGLTLHLDAFELALAERLAKQAGVSVEELISSTMRDLLIERFRIVRQQQQPATVVPFKKRP